jgi:drug/metabolite transporter (DMT)-like permease
VTTRVATAPAPLVARVMDRPAVAAVAGALTIAFSAILVKLADVAPVTAAVFRCAYALPLLGALAWWEDRRFGPRPARTRLLALPCGVLFAADLILWHYAIPDVGAGLSTVLGNVQVLVVPFLAWLLLRERADRRILLALPVVTLGIVLISGVLESGAYGENPARGVVFGVLCGLTYAAYILVLRQSGSDLRRPAGPLFDTTAVAAIVSIAAGLVIGDMDLVPSWPAHAWLLTLALSSQVLGWLLISVSLPRLPAALTSVTLTIQPVASVLLGIVLLGEQPTVLQLVGVACILGGLVAIARRRDTRGPETPSP